MYGVRYERRTKQTVAPNFVERVPQLSAPQSPVEEAIVDYYRRFPGDYLRDTRHLSLEEHGAYNLLLDHLYATEQPIASLESAIRICGVRSKRHQNAVKFVLENFFVKTELGYKQPRVEKEIKYAESKRLKAKQSAEKRWERNANAMPTHSEGNAIPDNQTTRQPEREEKPFCAPKAGGRNGCAPSDQFQKFWENYPRREGKKAALQIWNRKGLDKHLEEILKGLQNWKRARDPSYMPYAQGWLNQESWKEIPMIRDFEGDPDEQQRERERVRRLRQ